MRPPAANVTGPTAISAARAAAPGAAGPCYSHRMWLLLACTPAAPDGGAAPSPSDDTATPDTDAPDTGDTAAPDTGCDPRDWYADADLDGWGDDATVVSACTPPAGFVERGGDCDDTSAAVFPGALDVADGVDQDCDGTPDDAAIDLVFDPGAGTHAWLGLGAHVWVWDELWPDVLATLNGRFVRSSLYSLDDPDSAPAGGTAADFDAWLLTHDTAHTDAIATVEAARAAGRAVIGLVWEAPPAWESGGALLDAHVTDYARLVAGIVGRLADAGAAPDAVELFNEPDGTWNSYVGPGTYARVLAETRAELDARGLADVAILGPGLAFASSSDVWIRAADARDLGGFSTHVWDDAYASGDGLAATTYALGVFAAAADAADPGRRLPRLVTELGSKDTALHGVATNPADSCGDWPDQPEYAVRMLAYTLASAASGVGAVLPWQAVDPDWGGCWGTWGLVDVDGTPRPALATLAALGEAVPDGAVVVPPRWDDGALATAAFATSDTLVIALANPTAGDVTRAIGIGGNTPWALAADVADGAGTVVVRDPLDDGGAFALEGSVWIDTQNASYFAGDTGRLVANDDAVVTWTFDADVTRAEAELWTWGGVGSVRWSASADGATWTPLDAPAPPTDANWTLQTIGLDALPAGTRALRMSFDPREIAWTPQLGALDVTLAPAAPATEDRLAAERRLLVTIPAESTRILTLAR
jgi:hypothetical protein